MFKHFATASSSFSLRVFLPLHYWSKRVHLLSTAIKQSGFDWRYNWVNRHFVQCFPVIPIDSCTLIGILHPGFWIVCNPGLYVQSHQPCFLVVCFHHIQEHYEHCLEPSHNHVCDYIKIAFLRCFIKICIFSLSMYCKGERNEQMEGTDLWPTTCAQCCTSIHILEIKISETMEYS